MLSLRRVARLVVGGVLALALIVAGAGMPVQAQEKGDPARTSTEGRRVIAAEPLEITMLDGLAVGVNRNGARQFFANFDSGTFLTVDGRVYGPRPGANAGFLPLAFTLVSGVGPTGSGTPGDPFVIENTVLVGATGLRLTKRIAYVAGEPLYQIRLTVTNTGGAARSVTITEAADLYLNFPGSQLDRGTGFYDAETGAVGALSADGQNVQVLIPDPAHRPDAYQEANWAGTPPFWRLIGRDNGLAGPGFNNSVDLSLHDVAAGMQWDREIPAGGSTSLTSYHAFGPLGDIFNGETRSAIPAQITAVLRPEPNSTVTVGGTLTITVIIKNRGKGGAKNTVLTLPIDRRLTAIDARFSRGGAWVSALTATQMVIRIESLPSDDSVTATLRFRVEPSAAIGDALALQMSTQWADAAGGGAGQSNMSTLAVGAADRSEPVYPLQAEVSASQTAPSIRFSTTIFAPGEPVGLWYNTPSGRAVTVGTVKADINGAITVSFSTSGLSPGAYSMVAYGHWTEFTAVAPFAVP